jgi:hypothetical protein
MLVSLVMKSLSFVIAGLAGVALAGPVAASTIEFYDIVDANNRPVLDTHTLVGGDGASAITIGIPTDLTSLSGYTAQLQLFLSDDELQPDGEGAVVASLVNRKINVDQSLTPHWYTWAGDAMALLRQDANQTWFLDSELTSQPSKKDFRYYNTRLVFTSVPEADEWLLLGIGLLGVGGIARRRRHDDCWR